MNICHYPLAGTEAGCERLCRDRKTSTLVQYALVNPDSRMLYLLITVLYAMRQSVNFRLMWSENLPPTGLVALRQTLPESPGASLRITDVARKLNTRHWLLVVWH